MSPTEAQSDIAKACQDLERDLQTSPPQSAILRLKSIFSQVEANDNVVSNPRVNQAVLIVLFPLLLLFFKPSIKEFLGFYAIDLLAFFAYRSLDLRIYYRIFPETKLYFPKISDRIQSLAQLPGRLALFESIRRFPRNRSIYLIFASVIKVTPAFIYAVFTWGSPGEYFTTGLKALSICAFTFSFAISMSFLSYHNVMTQTLIEIHRRFHWANVFREVKVHSDGGIWGKMEIFSIGVLLGFFALLTSIIIADKGSSTGMSLVQFTYVMSSVTFFIFKILMTSRVQVMEGISGLVSKYMSNSDPSTLEALALSTNPHVAFHQKAINSLVYRIAETTALKDRLVDEFAEKSALTTIGENTGLFVHDAAKLLAIIKGNLYVMSKITDPNRLEQCKTEMTQATDSIHSMMQNLRRSIREDGLSVGISFPRLAFLDMASLARIYFLDDSTPDVRYECEIPSTCQLGLTQPILSQFFKNLIFNSNQNFLQHGTSDPLICLDIHEETDEFITFHYCDNGSGLTQEGFLALTQASTLERDGHGGIGLRLISTIIHKHGGSIHVVSKADWERGTCFELVLPKVRDLLPLEG